MTGIPLLVVFCLAIIIMIVALIVAFVILFSTVVIPVVVKSLKEAREEKEYQDLILLSREKTPVLVKGDLEKLQKITDAEQFVIGKINKLEKRRTEVVTDIALVLGKNKDTLKVTEIAELLNSQPEEQKRLLEIYDKLKDTLNKIQTVNDLNRELVNESLDFIKYNLDLFKSAYQEPVTGNYTKEASNASTVPGAGVFDAKQ